MKYTKEKPTVPGYWWVRGAFANDIIIEIVRRDDGSLYFDDLVNTWDIKKDCDALAFAGPIPEPVEHEDARLPILATLAEKIISAIEDKQAELLKVAQLEEGDERGILVETVAQLLLNEELDGRLHRGPATGS